MHLQAYIALPVWPHWWGFRRHRVWGLPGPEVLKCSPGAAKSENQRIPYYLTTSTVTIHNPEATSTKSVTDTARRPPNSRPFPF